MFLPVGTKRTRVWWCAQAEALYTLATAVDVGVGAAAVNAVCFCNRAAAAHALVCALSLTALTSLPLRSASCWSPCSDDKCANRHAKGLARGERKLSLNEGESQTFAAYVYMRVRTTIAWREIGGRRETAS